MEYKCGDASKFHVTTNGTFEYVESLTFICGIEGEWLQNTTLPECECKDTLQSLDALDQITLHSLLVTSCGEVPMVDPNLNLEPVEHRLTTEIGGLVSFRCQHGMRVESDFHLIFQNATCLANNQWQLPALGWQRCIESTSLNSLVG